MFRPLLLLLAPILFANALVEDPDTLPTQPQFTDRSRGIVETLPPPPIPPGVCKFVISPAGSNSIECINLGFDGRSLDQVLRGARIASKNDLTNASYTLEEIADSVRFLAIKFPTGNVTIGRNFLSMFPNLTIIQINDFIREPPRFPRTFDVDPSEFVENVPRLIGFSVRGLNFTENSLKALSTLKDRITTLSLAYSSPGRRLLSETAKFTQLKLFNDMSGLCENGPIFPDTFQNSAFTIMDITVQNCPMPKLTRRMFGSLPLLTILNLQSNNITEIEMGAFDRLPKLTHLRLDNNRIRNFPPNVFVRNPKLKEVKLTQNDLSEGFTKENFTGWEQFSDFQLLV